MLQRKFSVVAILSDVKDLFDKLLTNMLQSQQHLIPCN